MRPRTKVTFEDGRKVTLSTEEDHAAFFKAQSNGNPGDLDKPDKVNAEMKDPKKLLVNMLLWAMYINQNPDEEIKGTDIVGHVHSRDAADWVEDKIGGDSAAQSNSNPMSIGNQTGRVVFGYQRTLVQENNIDYVMWGTIGRTKTLKFLTEPVLTVRNGNASEERRIPAIWLKFYEAPVDGSRKIPADRRGDEAYSYIRRFFDNRSRTYKPWHVKYQFDSVGYDK